MLCFSSFLFRVLVGQVLVLVALILVLVLALVGPVLVNITDRSSAMVEKPCDACFTLFLTDVQCYLQNVKIAYLSHSLGDFWG